MKNLLDVIRGSLSSIDHPRFYDTERGFQGELATEISKRLPNIELDGVVIEQEYQKRMQDHGFRIRPDIILHIPFDYSNLDARDQGNFVVIELKLNASIDEAQEDYRKLSKMCDVLGYPLGIFINIGSATTYLSEYEGKGDSRIHAFAVELKDERVNMVEN